MSVVLRKYFWALVLVALTGIAYFIAAGLNQLVGAAFLPDATNQPTEPLARRQRAGGSLFANRRRADNILRRNLFDHTLGPQDGRLQDSPEERARLGEAGLVQRCEGALDLVSTVVSDDPDWSFAAINGGGKTLLYRRDSEIEGKKVKEIGWRVVLMESGGSDCYLGLFEPEATTPARASARESEREASSSRRSSTGDRELDDVIDSSIEKVNDNEYNVERSLVDRLLENQATLMRTARILPHEEGGQVTGFKIYGVRRSSLLGKIGLNNGDIIHSINGYEMTSPDKALEAYARLRTADRLTVRITRRGQQLNMDYNIR